MSGDIFGFRGDALAVEQAAREVAQRIAAFDKSIKIKSTKIRHGDGSETIAYKFTKKSALPDSFIESLKDWVSDATKRDITIVACDRLRNRMHG
jgi:predicted RNA-binding protein with PIN domain